MAAVAPASGTQYTIAEGPYRAEIASVGASLRTLTHDGRDLVLGFDADEVRPGFRGTTLAPWPNRIVDGVYTFDGVEYETARTDAGGRANALHGLASWLDFDVVAHDGSSVTLAAIVVPRTGYPWRIRVETTYALGADGLTQTVVQANESADAAPLGTGPHPYLVAGPGALDTWTFELPAAQVLEVTDGQMVPVALRSVTDDAERFDRRAPRVLGGVQIDHAFTGLERDADGVATVRVSDPSGVGVEMAFGADCPWVQVYTGDLPGGAATPGNRAGIAVEPMTCGPDAFNAHKYDYDTGLQVVAPGAALTASWRIAAI
ncbi:aldose 1-epimerase family protein [Microbacterium sp. W1N]|uniref:aldose 1-epimerase family protein n=1 Tax=Microbacterium festucae TaxID=2977531 RepID=UPI0021BF6FE5|nr:aldose 1-epimerase family protein [Microbacterium festucae]MCT9821342.1 aldose 1-epimerase family protein [Microbacterium festucae]